MNVEKLFLILIVFSIVSCSPMGYDEETLISDILENKSERIISGFYKQERLEKEDLKEVIKAYSEKLNSEEFEMVEYKDFVNFRKRDREGYMFIDSNNNIAYSITYKFTTLEDGTKQVNFIDFRSSEKDLQCIKFPSKFPIKCVIIPVIEPKSPQELSEEYPKEINGFNFYHLEQVSDKYLRSNNDTLKKLIIFNLGNLKIKNNFGEIVKGLDEELDLSNYTLAESNYYGEPTTNVIYDAGSYSEEELSAIKRVLGRALNEPIRVKPVRNNRSSIKKLKIGGLYSKSQIRIGG